MSFQSAGPTTVKARFWDREVRDKRYKKIASITRRSAERSEREELYSVSGRTVRNSPIDDGERESERPNSINQVPMSLIVSANCQSRMVYSEPLLD